jgi:AcrR family transcriptional regulator
MTAKAGRSYESPLRAEQAAATRDRIVDATVALLQDHDGSSFGMQEVADRAGVAIRTVYRAFPTKDELLAGVLAVLRERFEATAGDPPTTREELEASVVGAVRAIFELEPLYRALFATAAGRELHRATSAGRHASVDRAFADSLDGLDAHRRRLVVAVLHLITSSSSVLWLKDYAGLDVGEATDAVAWALAALIQAAQAAPAAQDEAGR